MSKTTKRAYITFGSIFSVLAILVASYVIYCWATYIDETISIGQAYGFTIGETKLEVFEKAKNVYKNTSIYILYPLNKNDFGPHKKISFQPQDYKLIDGRDKWVFYFDEEYFNLIKLTFEQRKLREIHRHRKNFELP